MSTSTSTVKICTAFTLTSVLACATRLLQMSRGVAACLFLILVTTGCSDSTRNVASLQTPQLQPLADGASVLVAQNRVFNGAEDGVWQGQLTTISSANSIPGRESAVFVITQPPVFGSLELDSSSGSFIYVPEPDYFGLDSFQYQVVSDGLSSNQAIVDINIANVNDAPELVVELDRVIEQGAIYSLLLAGTDKDGDELIYSAENLPGWLTLNANTGLLAGRPEQTDVGIYRDLRFFVTDPDNAVAEVGPFALEVLDINDPPVINPAQFPRALDAGERVVVNLFPDDPDGDFVVLETELNDFADVEILGGSLALTASSPAEVTSINLVVIARDLLGSTSREIIPITIFPVTSSGRGRTLHGRSRGAGIHMVVLSEGYKQDEANTFRDDAENLIGLMQQDPAIAAHFGAWNIHSVMQPSIDSGIDDDVTRDFRNTAFDAGYFCRGIQRLICANDAQVFDVALEEYPELDQIVLLVNDPRFGGSGGSIAVASSSAPEIAIHELGHSVASLADEYVDTLIPESLDDRFVEGRFANISASDDPELVPWAHWIDDIDDFPTVSGVAGVGIFEGAFYVASGVYRATSNSRMRENLAHFGPVNGEQWALSVYQRSNPIIAFSPVTQQMTISNSESQLFTVAPVFDNSIQSISWFVDDVEMISARNSRELLIQRDSGQYSIGLVVRDISGTIRIASPNASEFRWQWILNVVSQ